MKIYLDDVRTLPEVYRLHEPGQWTLVRSYHEAIAWMTIYGCPAFISFDHDLGTDGDPNELNGHDVAKWMVKHDLDMDGQFIPDSFSYTVHSANPVGAANIVGLLESYLDHKKEDLSC